MSHEATKTSQLSHVSQEATVFKSLPDSRERNTIYLKFTLL